MSVQRNILNAIDRLCENISQRVQETSSKEIALARLQQTRRWVARMNEANVNSSLDKIVNRISRLRTHKLPKDAETAYLQSLLFPLETLIKFALDESTVGVASKPIFTVPADL